MPGTPNVAKSEQYPAMPDQHTTMDSPDNRTAVYSRTRDNEWRKRRGGTERTAIIEQARRMRLDSHAIAWEREMGDGWSERSGAEGTAR